MTTIPVIDLARTGANIVNLRKAAGLSVHDLQVVFGFNSPQAIYKWQNGTALPTVDNLIVLAALLHVRIDDILVTTVASLSRGAPSPIWSARLNGQDTALSRLQHRFESGADHQRRVAADNSLPTWAVIGRSPIGNEGISISQP